jgi:hypothetical protein
MTDSDGKRAKKPTTKRASNRGAANRRSSSGTRASATLGRHSGIAVKDAGEGESKATAPRSATKKSTERPRRRPPTRAPKGSALWRWAADSKPVIIALASAFTFFVTNGIPFLDRYGDSLRPGVITRQTASGFFRDVWFEGAPHRDRDELLRQRTTEAFRESGLGEEPGFSQYWSRVSRVTDITTDNRTLAANQFLVSWTVHLRNGLRDPHRNLLTLKCSGWRAFTPIVNCDRDHVRIDDSVLSTRPGQ